MNKLFSKIAALSVGLAMAVGVGVALGHEGVREAKAGELSLLVFSIAMSFLLVSFSFIEINPCNKFRFYINL